MKKEKLSIIIPVYNEEKTITEIIKKVQAVKIPNILKEIIIVNDCSKDNSFEIITKLAKKYKNIKFYSHKENKGKGAALRTGFSHVTGDYIVIQDADLEYNPEDFNRLITPIRNSEADVVYGSRMLGRIDGFQITSHYYGNLFLSLITRLLYGNKITDMETCYKMMKSEVVKNLNLKANSFDIEPEITAKIIKKGYKIIEIPINYRSRSFLEGKKIHWDDGIIAMITLIKYRFFD
ncbi:glycosyltransferase family 2 protein [Candidatus Pacearchaeota archaeon]|nr:glycosyltransferase family 2 protein [Candidatus Pacearchaeota archaeon]